MVQPTLIPLTIPRMLGYEVLEIVSGSMEPAIPTGSIVFVADAAPETIEPGDIIAFDNRTELPVVHRVTANSIVEGQFITKGDANAEVDIQPVGYRQLIGKVVFHLSVLGRIADWAVTLMGKIYAAGFLLAALLLQFLAGRFSELAQEAAETGHASCS